MRRFILALVTAGLVIGAGEASAQIFISPLIGANFGGVSGCPKLTGCENEQLNVGVSVGVLGSVLGTELEVAYAPHFFGSAPDLASSVLTVMGNILLAPKVGPIRPYMLAGVGLLKTRVDLTQVSRLTTDDTTAGWNVGGGVMAFAGSHLGVRADLRYFHSFGGFSVRGFTLPSAALNYSRASAGVVLKF